MLINFFTNIFFLSPRTVHPTVLRHEAGAGVGPPPPRVGPGEAQAPDHRLGREGQLRAAAKAETESEERPSQGRQNHGGLDLHGRHQHGRHQARGGRPRHGEVSEDQR